jgi:hypothetical protein
MNEKMHIKISPPLEGGVDGSTDFLIFTKLDFPAGVVDFWEISYNIKR